MKERPILFNAPMVRAILAGAKTQTRRIAKRTASGRVKETGSSRNWHVGDVDAWHACPYGVPKDRLWVRETWRHTSATMDEARALTEDIMSGTAVRYRANDPNPDFETWRPSIHMPRAASRITLEITNVRVERLQDISIADAMAEGVVEFNARLRGLEPCMEWRYAYEDLWRTINGPGSWDANPWVWVLEFRRV